MNNYIISVNAIKEFCEQNLSSIKVFVVSELEIEVQRLETTTLPQTIPGTRKYHDFTPITNEIIGCKTVSSEEKFSKRFNLLTKETYNWSSNTYVSLAIDNDWKIGLIFETFEDEMAAKIFLL